MSGDFRKQLHGNLNQKSTDELIEIWQTNNRFEWSDVAFDVVRELLMERHVELPAQNEPITEPPEEEKTERTKFNWRLPLLGALGFGIGFAVMGAIMLTIYNLAENAFNPGHVGLDVGAFRGIVAGGLGGAGLGWALKDKKLALNFSLAGAFGFGIAFALVIAVHPSDLGWAIMEFMGGPVGGGFISLEAGLAKGLGIGVIVGAIGGAVLGLATPKYRAISSLLLCLAGIISFGNIFAFGSTIFDGNFYSLWNALGGALGGAALGAALALYYMIADRIHRKQS